MTPRSVLSVREPLDVAPVPRRRRLADLLAMAAVPLGVLVTWRWGEALTAAGRRLFLGAEPFHGAYDARVSLAIVVPVAVAGAVIVFGGRAAERWSFRFATSAAVLAAAGWAVALSAMDGLSAIAAPLTQSDEYLADVGQSGSLRSLLASYVKDLPGYHTHVRGHPPGPLLLLEALDRAGLRGPVPAAVLAIGAGGSAVAAVAITIRAVAGAATARRVLPFLALLPAALWVATSLDAVFLGVSAWATAAIAVAARRSGAGSTALAVGGGVGWGLALHLSYSVAPLGLLVAAVAVVPDRRRTVRVLSVAAAALVSVFAVFLGLGFNWFAGVAATHAEWARGAGPVRPWLYFAVANVAIAAVAVGPAVVAALTRRPPPGVAVLVWPVLAALAIADVMGFFRGEVERIWLPFMFWLAASTALLPHKSVRWWLTAQATTAIVLQALLVSRW